MSVEFRDGKLWNGDDSLMLISADDANKGFSPRCKRLASHDIFRPVYADLASVPAYGFVFNGLEVSHDIGSGIVTITEPRQVTIDSRTIISADQFVYCNISKKFTASGNVKILDEGKVSEAQLFIGKVSNSIVSLFDMGKEVGTSASDEQLTSEHKSSICNLRTFV
jgi:hypothetical protein